MSEDDALDFSRQQLLDDTGGGGVGEMAVARHDPLFDRPRSHLAGLQKFFVVIGLDYERVHFAQPFHQQPGRITEIGDETESAAAGVKSVTNRVDRIMWNRERLHRDVADGKLRAGPEQTPVAMFA